MTRDQIDAASAYHCAQLIATDDFARKRGAILLTGGGFAKTFRPLPQNVPLCIDKAALNAMAIILHQQLAPRGIFVGSVIVQGTITHDEGWHNPQHIAQRCWKMYTERQADQVVY